jgi:coenzyme F420-reducing hydrogenase alpha subunit
VAEIACRICSICSTVHKVVALQAVEQALKVTVSRQTVILRELAVQGGQIESHALHIFCLALPDYLGVNGFPGLAAIEPHRLQQGLRLKALGNLIQETVGGRAIHLFNLLTGGIGRVPGREQLQKLADRLAELHDDVADVITLLRSLPEALPSLPPLPFCAVSGGPPLFGDMLATTTGTCLPADSAAAWLNEKVEAHTHAKVSRFDSRNVFMVGPLARLNLAMPAEFAALLTDAPISASLLARGVELQQALERAADLVEQLLREGLNREESLNITPSAGEGHAVIEAPRGLLLHSYHFDAEGFCTFANIITPTAINQAAIELSLKALVAALEGAGYEQVKTSAERLIRCFDPCISCAVH